jgi:DsbC/DsbD-like thiol-disulfide interchange protein
MEWRSHHMRRSRLAGSCVKTDMRRRCSSLALYPALALGAALLLCVASAQAEGTPIPHGTLELVAENQWIAAGRTIHLGLHFQLEPGWHIYWVNPGDSGEPPRVKWQLPPGVSVGEVQWPTPRRLGTSSIADFGYEQEVMLIVPIHAEANMATQGLAQVGAEVKVLVCREMCIPGKAQLSLTLPVKSQPPVPDARDADLFAAARKSMPRPVPSSWRISVTDAKDSFLLFGNPGRPVTHVEFFPAAESQIKDAAPQEYLVVAGGFRLTLRKSDQLLKPIERLKGVLVLAGDRGYLIDVPVTVNKADAGGYSFGERDNAGLGAAVFRPASTRGAAPMAH